MNRTPRGIRSLTALLALLAFAAGAQAPADPADSAVKLDPITVTGATEPLDRSLHLLRLLVDQSAPCLGCDAVLRIKARPPVALTVLEFLLLPTEPPVVDEATRLARDIKLQDSPDLDSLRR